MSDPGGRSKSSTVTSSVHTPNERRSSTSFSDTETTKTRLSVGRPSTLRGSHTASSSSPAPVAIREDISLGLRTWIKQQLGMAFTDEQLHVFHERTLALCRELELTPEMLLVKLRSSEPVVVRRVAEKLSTNYTFFQREPEMFEYLVQQVLPVLPSGPLRFWSAATSSGDEAYSLAMTCLEYFGPSAAGRVRILGTDISERQVAHAERGVYPKEQTALLDRVRASRWFTETDRGQVRVTETPRQLCTFRRLNLTQPEWPFSNRFHVIFLRNVLYYFDLPTRQHVLERCYDAAEDGAYLITSLTEPLMELSTRWRAVRPAVFRREPRR